MGLVGQAGRSVYSACKGALIGFTKSAAIELAREKIRINCVAPGLIETEGSADLFNAVTPEQKQSLVASHPLGLGRPADVAAAVAFLLADSGRWVTGTTLVVDGGYTAK
jgi:NAD(P)-dependent dehydrogenase (short-subunit alcohol dehydrogenase family)